MPYKLIAQSRGYISSNIASFFAINVIINSEPNSPCSRVEGRDARCKLLATCSHRGAESQEGGEIARAWIADPKVYPVYQCPMMVFVSEDTDDRFVKIVILLIVLDRLC